MTLRVFFLSVFALGLSVSLKGQLKAYKYIIVPKKFEVFTKENQYETSTLAKHLFTKKGFCVVYDDALPKKLLHNRCLGLVAELIDDSSLFTTKIIVVLKDCQSKVVFKTLVGKSRKKAHKVAYREALVKAFVSFDKLVYDDLQGAGFQEDAELLILRCKDDMKFPVGKPRDPVVEQVATVENQSYKSWEPVPSSFTKGKKETDSSILEVLYAQTIPNGFLLVDDTSQVRLRLVATSLEGVFLVEDAAEKGVVFQKEGQWFWEYVEQGERKREVLPVTF